MRERQRKYVNYVIFAVCGGVELGKVVTGEAVAELGCFLFAHVQNQASIVLQQSREVVVVTGEAAAELGCFLIAQVQNQAFIVL